MRALLLGGSLLALIAAWPAVAQTANANPSPTPPGPATQPDATAPAPGAGSAQTAPPANPAEVAPEDIVVTARLRGERLRDVPVAATALDANAIADQGGLRGMKDVLANTPSAHFLDTSAPITSEVSIRGSATSRGTNADTTVGLFRDGMFVPGGALGGRTFTPMDLFDVERVEVLRGPQGALYGRNSVGGAINVVTNKPAFKPEGSVSGTFGRFDRFEGEGIVNLPVSDTVAMRFGVAATDQRQGYVYDPDRKTYLDRERYTGLKGQIRWKPDDRTNINLSADWFHWNAPPLELVVVIPPGSNETLAPIKSFPGGWAQNRRLIGHNGVDSAIQEQHTALLTIEHDFGWAKFTSLTSYRRRYNTNDFDLDAVDESLREQIAAEGANILTLNPNSQSYVSGRTRRFMQEMRLAGDVGPVKWLVGGDYTTLYDRRRELQDREPAPPPRAASLVNPTDNLLNAYLRNISWSAYGSLSWTVTSRFELTAEGRFTRDVKRFSASNLVVQTGQYVPNQTIVAQSSAQNFSYTLAADYKLGGGWLAYARIGTAYRPGGFNSALGNPAAPNPVVPRYGNEEAITYEVGTKGDLARGLYFTGAGYLTITSNALVAISNGCATSAPPCFEPQTQFLINSGKSRVYGIEAELNARAHLAGGELSFAGGGSYQRSTFLSGATVGLELARVPHWLYDGNVNYRHPLGGDLSGYVNVKFNGTIGGVQDVIVNPYELSSYATADARIGLQRDGIELALFGRNIFNAQPVVFKAATTERYLTPVIYGVELIYRW